MTKLTKDQLISATSDESMEQLAEEGIQISYWDKFTSRWRK